jgi:hypothetical protein
MSRGGGIGINLTLYPLDKIVLGVYMVGLV